MIKTFLILVILQNFLFSSQQIILVISQDYTSPKAKLTCYEDGKQIFETIDVNIGKNGLGFGLGEIKLKENKQDIVKKEGDKKAPIGIFKLTKTFGYDKKQTSSLKYIYLEKNLICVDDSNSKFYNKIIQMPKNKPKSFEIMRREDSQYALGVVVAHNAQQKKQAGSCIFLHVQESIDAPTAGCTSMSFENMKKIVEWLDESKNPILIQVPKSYTQEIKKLYPTLPL